MPSHAMPTLQKDGSIVRGECWCRPWVQIVVAEDDDGNTYRYLNHIHGADLSVMVAFSTTATPPV